MTFQYPDEWQEYIVHKGFIAINGCSLTVVKEQEGNTFQIYFIPETLRATTFVTKQVGDKVNIEIDTQIINCQYSQTLFIRFKTDLIVMKIIHAFYKSSLN